MNEPARPKMLREKHNSLTRAASRFCVAASEILRCGERMEMKDSIVLVEVLVQGFESQVYNYIVCDSVLQRVAVCCSVLQGVAVCCSVLQSVWQRGNERLYCARGGCGGGL